MTEEAKEFISAEDLASGSFALAKKVYDSGFHPDVMVCLWRGGTPVGLIIDEYLRFKNITTQNIVVKAESYIGPGSRKDVVVENVDMFVSELPPDSKVLIVDDIYDTGFTMKKVCEQFARRTKNIKTATLYFKPGKHSAGDGPDFYFLDTDRWIVFPHELVGLTEEELSHKAEHVRKSL